MQSELQLEPADVYDRIVAQPCSMQTMPKGIKQSQSINEEALKSIIESGVLHDNRSMVTIKLLTLAIFEMMLSMSTDQRLELIWFCILIAASLYTY